MLQGGRIAGEKLRIFGMISLISSIDSDDLHVYCAVAIMHPFWRPTCVLISSIHSDDLHVSSCHLSILSTYMCPHLIYPFWRPNCVLSNCECVLSKCKCVVIKCLMCSFRRPTCVSCNPFWRCKRVLSTCKCVMKQMSHPHLFIWMTCKCIMYPFWRCKCVSRRRRSSRTSRTYFSSVPDSPKLWLCWCLSYTLFALTCRYTCTHVCQSTHSYI